MPLVVYMHAQFEVSSFTPFPRYGGGTKISKVGHIIPSLPLWPNLAFLWIALVVNLSVKFDGNILIGDRYMAILLLCWFGCEMLILAHFGSLTPKCSQILPRPQKGTSLAGHMHFGIQIVPITQEMWPGRVLKKAKKEKKRKETQRCDKLHMCPDHPCCTTPTKVVRHSQPCQVSSKLVKWLRLPYGTKSAIFLCLALWLV